MKPFIEATKKRVKILDITVVIYSEKINDLTYLKILWFKKNQDIAALPELEEQCFLLTVDQFVKSAKISAM